MSLHHGIDLRTGPRPAGRSRAVRAAARRRRPLPWLALALPMMAGDALALGAVSIAIGETYYRLVLGRPHAIATHLDLAALLSFLIVSVSALVGRYRAGAVLRGRDQAAPLATAFAICFVFLLVLLFLTKSTELYSRSVLSLVFVASFPVLFAVRRAAVGAARRLQAVGLAKCETVLVVGSADRIAHDAAALANRPGFRVVGRAVIRARHDEPGFETELANAVAIARRTAPDSIVIQHDWSARETIGALVSRLAELPAAIVLGPDPYIQSLVGGRPPDGEAPIGLPIIGQPLTPAQLGAKRCFDMAAAGAALVALAPLLLTIALLVLVDGGRPVLFRQTRYGYNREPFQVWKFRTMRTGAEPQPFRQATLRDERVTAVGRLLRRTNLDELPQLFNVLTGAMSLVGPRPHPVELDDRYVPLIKHYSRRHKIRPGITGWAQVNGHRGETDTTEKMQGRITHDLHYLSHWSLWLDVKILALTLLSATSYRNAV